MNKQYKIIKHCFHNLDRMQSHVKKVEEKDDSEDDDDSSYLDCPIDSENSTCVEDDEMSD